MANSTKYQMTWDNSNIYQSFSDPKLLADVEDLKKGISAYGEKNEVFSPNIEVWSQACGENSLSSQEEDKLLDECEKSLIERERLSCDYSTMMTFGHCQTSTDTQHKEAKELLGKLSAVGAAFSKANKPLELALQRAPEAFIEKLLSRSSLENFKFEIHHSRQLKDGLLSTSEEVLVSGLSQDGLHAWGKLYQSIAGTMKVEVGQEEMGLAQAASLVRQGDREKRKLAYEGINQAWRQHEESAAAVLNAINGWRLEMNKNRSQKRDWHYLDVSCHQSRITRETLSALIDETYAQREVGHRALRSMAKLMDLPKLAPYDLLAPAHLGDSGGSIPFDEAIELISESFNEFSPEMGNFAKMMAERGWIDARPTDARAQGAYCTKFARTREPRVFMTYAGSMGNVVTLAHELGHAYHNWVMRDLPRESTRYSMTLAETASIFAETLVKRALLEKSTNREDRLKIMWQDAESAAALMINIPARFEFEKNMVEARKERPLSPEEMRTLMSDAWKKWYGETLTEVDDMFWASKLHFSISSLGFYNYPYLFGYLFSLGIYGQKDLVKGNFTELYHGILRDTGSLSAEDLIKKHLGKDIRQKDFWAQSMAIVEKQITAFEDEVRQ